MKKKVIILSSIILVVLLLSNIVTYAVTKKNLLDYFFKNSKKDIAVEKDLLIKENQKIVIDDYTITLEESLCEKNTQLGYLVFSVKKQDGRVEADLTNDGILKSFGKKRFIFDYEATGSFIEEAQYEGDVLRVYILFEANDITFEQPRLGECVRITDLKEKNNGEYRQYAFDLKCSDKCKKYKTDNGMIYISSLGCKYISSEAVDDINIKINTTKGEIKLIKDDFSESGHREQENITEVHYTNMFNKLLNLSRVEEVLLNNKKLKEI